MSSSSQTTVTRLLVSLQSGDDQAMQALFPLVYDVLHAQAHRQRQQWHGDFTLNTTALVHEAYIKLIDQRHATYESRAHFLSVVAKAMRHILVDYARRRRAEKRGGDLQKRSLEEMAQEPGALGIVDDERLDELLSLEAALTQLARHHAREARVVECRFFGEMTVEETATALHLSARTVKRDWAMAQSRLYKIMTQGASSDDEADDEAAAEGHI